MTRSSDKASRRSMRLPDYDYSQPGAYFITFCTRNRECVLSDITDGQISLTAEGDVVQSVLERMPQRYPEVSLDTFVIMPNHVHAIIWVVGAIHESPLPKEEASSGTSIQTARRRMLIPKVVGHMKMNAAKPINQMRRCTGVPVWQRGYHDHVIRTEPELAAIREYIATNALSWEEDEHYPGNPVE